jgi:hypothetical protein
LDACGGQLSGSDCPGWTSTDDKNVTVGIQNSKCKMQTTHRFDTTGLKVLRFRPEVAVRYRFAF